MDRPMPPFKVTTMQKATDGLYNHDTSNVISVGVEIQDRAVFDFDDVRILSVGDHEMMAEGLYAADIRKALTMTAGLWDAGIDVWFHCQYGRGRSPAFAFIMLVSYLGAEHLREAYHATTTGQGMTEAKVRQGIEFSEGLLQHTIPLLPDTPAREALMPFAKSLRRARLYYAL